MEDTLLLDYSGEKKKEEDRILFLYDDRPVNSTDRKGEKVCFIAVVAFTCETCPS